MSIGSAVEGNPFLVKLREASGQHSLGIGLHLHSALPFSLKMKMEKLKMGNESEVERCKVQESMDKWTLQGGLRRENIWTANLDEKDQKVKSPVPRPRYSSIYQAVRMENLTVNRRNRTGPVLAFTSQKEKNLLKQKQ